MAATDLNAPAVDGMWRRVVRSAGFGTFDYSPSTGLGIADPACRESLGIGEDAPIGREDFLARVHPEDRERVRKDFDRAMEPGAGTCQSEFRRTDQVDNWVSIAGAVLLDANEQPERLLLVVRENMGQRRAELARDGAIADSVRAVRVSDLFAGILGHDLRTPLGAIVTAADLGGRDPDPAKVKKSFSRILASAVRMSRMIDQLLDFTRARLEGGLALSVADVDLAAVTNQVVIEIAEAHSESEVRVEVRGDANGRWDADRLAQVISNLVGNAIKHGVGSGGVRVGIDGTSPATVSIVVENPGVIPVDLLPVLFNPFRGVDQVRGNGTGLGLGLYITRQIALAHGGEIEATSSEADGTRLVVRLPRAPAADSTRPVFAAADAEIAALSALARAPLPTNVTARLFGSVPLPERDPQAYWALFDDYSRMLDVALQRRVYKGTGERLSEEVRALGERLGVLGAGPREVAELHARALRQMTRSAKFAHSQALVSEGRMLSFELMGHLLSYYRRHARQHSPPPVRRNENG